MARERSPRILQCAVTFHGYLYSLRWEESCAQGEGQGCKELGSEKRRFAPPPGRIMQLRSFPSELFLQFYAGMGEGGGGLAPLPVILLRNSDNAAAAMNNGGITRRKSANVFFLAAPKPPAGTFESPYRSLFDFPPLSDSTGLMR